MHRISQSPWFHYVLIDRFLIYTTIFECTKNRIVRFVVHPRRFRACMKSVLQNCYEYNKWFLTHFSQVSLLDLLYPHKSTEVGSCWKTEGELLVLGINGLTPLCVQQQFSIVASHGQRLSFDGYWYLSIYKNLETLFYTECLFGINPIKLSRCHLRFLFDQFPECQNPSEI